MRWCLVPGILVIVLCLHNLKTHVIQFWEVLNYFFDNFFLRICSFFFFFSLSLEHILLDFLS